MSPKAIAVAGLSAIALAASGCAGDTESGADVSAAFKERFGEAPWYRHVTEVKMSSAEHPNSLEVTTDLDEVSETLTGAICHAGFSLEHEVVDEIEAVVVVTSDGEEGGCA